MNIFLQPYPIISNAWLRLLWGLVSASLLFVCLFLLAQVSNIAHFGEIPDFLLGILGATWAGIIILTYVITPIFLPKVFDPDHWRLWKHLLWIFLITILLLFSFGGIGWYQGVESELWQQRTLIIALPVIIIPQAFNLIRFSWLKKRARKAENALREALHVFKSKDRIKRQAVHLHEAGKSALNIRSIDFFFIQAEGKFVYAYYQEEDKVKRKLITRHINSVAEDLDSLDQIARCHINYLINCENIQDFNSNAQGIRITCIGELPNLPVARKYVKILLEQLSS